MKFRAALLASHGLKAERGSRVMLKVHNVITIEVSGRRRKRRGFGETNSATLLGERRFVAAHGSAPRVQNVKVFGADALLGEVMQPSDQHDRIGFKWVFDSASDADGHPAKLRVPRFYKIARGKPLCSGGPRRGINQWRGFGETNSSALLGKRRFVRHLSLHQRAESPDNEETLAWVCVGVNRIGMFPFLLILASPIRVKASATRLFAFHLFGGDADNGIAVRVLVPTAIRKGNLARVIAPAI